MIKADFFYLLLGMCVRAFWASGLCLNENIYIWLRVSDDSWKKLRDSRQTLLRWSMMARLYCINKIFSKKKIGKRNLISFGDCLSNHRATIVVVAECRVTSERFGVSSIQIRQTRSCIDTFDLINSWQQVWGSFELFASSLSFQIYNSNASKIFSFPH